MQQSYFADLPCGNNCPPECEIRSKMINLANSLRELHIDGSAILVDAFLKSYRELCQTQEYSKAFPPNIALPALFDLVMSAKYSEKMAAEGGWTYCSGNEGLQGEPTLYFPFLKTCPRCSVK